MSELSLNVNWLAVIAGTVASFLVGWLWYSPKLFGIKWAEGVGVKLTDSKLPKGMAIAMAAQLFGTFLFAWMIGVTAANDAPATAVLVALTIAVLQAASGLYSQKSSYAIATESGFVIAMAMVMILCHVLL